jgi:ABC-type antimicrobial peptide transport system permease subunit
MASVGQWEVGSLKLKPDVVWSMALSSLRLRIGRSLLTVLTIATSSAFMMYLLTMPRQRDVTEQQSWTLMMVLALIVSTVGLLNTMLMSVTQRYREIGTMKCLGALDSFVLLSVLLEAVLLGAAGACIGIVAGFAISSLLAFADFGTGFVGQMRLSWFVAKIALVFVTAMTLTTVGASIPAWIASKMPPMDAMRGEK